MQRRITDLFSRVRPAAATSAKEDKAEKGEEEDSMEKEEEEEHLPPAAAEAADGAKEAVISARDIGHFVKEGKLSATEKLTVLDSWMPPPGYQFPLRQYTNRSRACNPAWFNDFPWARYSRLVEGIYCGPCVAFGHEAFGTGRGGHQRPTSLVAKPFVDWKNAKGKDGILDQHAKSPFHMDCISRAQGFYKERETGRTIKTVISKKEKKAEKARKAYLHRLSELVELLGRQGLAFRGDDMEHSYSVKIPGLIEADGEENVRKKNPGNFIALLEYQLKIDTALRKYAKKLPKNATYQGPGSQNQFIELIGRQHKEQIVMEIKEKAGGIYAVLADESTDASHSEQLCVCVRYVINEANEGDQIVIKEAFLDFLVVTDLTGEGLAKSIAKVLVDAGLSLAGLVACGFDGAPAMSGHMRGAQAYLRRMDCPWLTYTHCSAHLLNLTLLSVLKDLSSAACEVTTAIAWVRNSGQRNQMLRTIVDEANVASASKKKQLISACETRWVQRGEAYQRFLDLFPYFLDLLEKVKEETIGDKARGKAENYAVYFSQFEIFFKLHMLSYICSLFGPVSEALQAVQLDLVSAVAEIRNLRDQCANIARDYDAFATRLWDKVEREAASFSIELSVPRRARRNRDVDIKKHYYDHFWIPMIEKVVEEIDYKYDKHTEQAMSLQCLIPAFMDQIEPQDLIDNIAVYASVLNVTDDQIATEVTTWLYQFQQGTGKADRKNINTVLSAIDNCRPAYHPVVYKALQILATIPASTATPERTFSVMRRLKTWMRTSMTAVRFSGLAHMSVHRNTKIDHKRVVNDFLAAEPRRPPINYAPAELLDTFDYETGSSSTTGTQEEEEDGSGSGKD